MSGGGIRSAVGRFLDRLEAGMRLRFSVDRRALAAFRIALGALVVANFLLRSRHLVAFYTDDGVLTRSALAAVYPTARELSVFAQLGATWWTVLLFVIGSLAGLCLLVGYRSRLAALVSFVLVVSLHGRNPLVLNGGDLLLRHLLFWAVLVPIGSRWSLDAARRTHEGSRVFSAGTAGLLLQVVIVYLVNIVLKSQGELWVDGGALEYVFSLDRFTILLGDVIADMPLLLSVLERIWLLLLLGSWLLIVLRGWPRAALAGMFAAAHFGMFLTMMLGLFPLISIAGLIPFLPPVIWDRLEARLEPLEEQLPVVSQEDSTALRPPRRVLPDWNRLRAAGRTAVQGFAVLAVVVMVLFNVGTVAPDDLDPTEPTPIPSEDPHWNMFAPNPLGTDGWYLMAGTLESGEQVDAFHGGELTFDRPPDLADTMPSARWRKYFGNVFWGDERLRQDFTSYLCERWNRTHESTVQEIAFYYMAEETRLDEPEVVDKRRAAVHSCP